jgi:hypothetical protein
MNPLYYKTVAKIAAEAGAKLPAAPTFIDAGPGWLVWDEPVIGWDFPDGKTPRPWTSDGPIDTAYPYYITGPCGQYRIAEEESKP